MLKYDTVKIIYNICCINTITQREIEWLKLEFIMVKDKQKQNK